MDEKYEKLLQELINEKEQLEKSINSQYVQLLDFKAKNAKLKEQLQQINQHKEQVLNKMNSLKSIFEASDYSPLVLVFILIIKNIEYVMTGKVETYELDQERMVKEFLSAFSFGTENFKENKNE